MEEEQSVDGHAPEGKLQVPFPDGECLRIGFDDLLKVDGGEAAQRHLRQHRCRAQQRAVARHHAGLKSSTPIVSCSSARHWVGVQLRPSSREDHAGRRQDLELGEDREGPRGDVPQGHEGEDVHGPVQDGDGQNFGGPGGGGRLGVFVPPPATLRATNISLSESDERRRRMISMVELPPLTSHKIDTNYIASLPPDCSAAAR